MGLFGSLFGDGVNEGVAQARETEGSVIIDVRSQDEYRNGHIPRLVQRAGERDRSRREGGA